MSNDTKGVIYILTNPSFPEFVKIGYADDVKSRVKILNRTECTPFAFRIYATYEVDTRLTDMKLHNIIDKLNPELRSIDTVDGKKRVREFYAMSAEDAFALFEAIAEIHGRLDKLKRVKATKKDEIQEDLANEIEAESNERKEKFSFSSLGIPIGAELEYIHDTSIKAIVMDHKRTVSYNGKETSLSALARRLLNRNSQVQGTLYFTYLGETLVNLRKRLGK